MNRFPENRLGYLALTRVKGNSPFCLKADKIVQLSDSEFNTVIINTVDSGEVAVKQSMQEIFTQLENIHPSML